MVVVLFGMIRKVDHSEGSTYDAHLHGKVREVEGGLNSGLKISGKDFIDIGRDVVIKTEFPVFLTASLPFKLALKKLAAYRYLEVMKAK